MINAGTVQVKLFADVKQYTAAMNSAAISGKNFASSMTKMAKVSVAAFAVITVTAAKMSTDFDKRLREISTLIIGVTEKDIKGMSREIRDLANTTGKALDDLGKAKYDIISAGFIGVKESMVLLNSAARLAVGGVTSVTKSADLLTSALNLWQKSGTEAEHAADVLFTTVRLGKTTMDELAGSVGRVFPTAKTLNASLEDVGAALATITAGGISTYEASTYLNQAFTKMGAPSISAARAMLLHGIEVKKLDDGMFDLLSTIKQFQGYDLQQMRQFFPEIRAVKAILAMANNMDFLERAIRDTNNAAGASQIAFLKMSQAWSTKLNKSAMRFKDVMVDIGDNIMPTVVDAFDEFMDNITSQDIDKFADSLKEAVKSLAEIGGFLTKHADIIVQLMTTVTALGAGVGIGKLIGKFGVLLTSIIAISVELTAATGSLALLGNALAGGGAVAAGGLAVAFPPAAVFIAIVAALGALWWGIDRNIRINKKYKESLREQFHTLEATKEIFTKLGMNVNAIDLDLVEKGKLPDIDELVKIANALNKVNEELWFSKFISTPDFSQWSVDLEKEIVRVRKLMMKQPVALPYEGGVITQPFGLGNLWEQIHNLQEFNKALEDIDLNKIEYTKETFKALKINLKPFEGAANALMTINETLGDIELSKINTGALGVSMEEFKSLSTMLVGKEATLNDILDWFANFNKEAKALELSKIDELYDSMLMINTLRYQGMDFKLPMMEDVFKIDLAPLKEAVNLMVTYGITFEEMQKYEMFSQEEIDKLKRILFFLEEAGYDVQALAEYFGIVTPEVDELKSAIQDLGREISNVTDSITNDFNSAFADVILSGRTAAQELEDYNNGLSNSYRSVAEIQEDAWTGMWDRILRTVVENVAIIVLEVALITAAILLGDALTNGAVSGLLSSLGGVSKLVDAALKFASIIAGLFNFSTSIYGDDGVRVEDAIITPSGQVIKTSPDDYIMAMKRPQDMNTGGGGYGGMNVIINAVDAKSFEELMVRNPQAMGRGIGNAIEQRKISLTKNTNSDRIRATY